MPRKLTHGEIEQSLGRAAMITELQEVESRIGPLARQAQAADGAGDKAVAEAKRDAAKRMHSRAAELTETLWGIDEAEGETWIEKLRALPLEEAKLVAELVLKRRPEVTPPEDLDEWEVGRIRAWLIEKIGELPEEERDTWTR